MTTDLVFRPYTPAEIDAYEREFGVKPVGYRGTGAPWWFRRWHPDEAPCCKCGVVTDRWVVGMPYIGTVAWKTPHVDQRLGPADQPEKARALCFETVWPFCDACELRHSVEQERRTANNPAVREDVRERSRQFVEEYERSVAA